MLAGSLLNQTFLFVGYSRVDPNFREIFDEVAGLYEGGSWQAFALSVDAAGSGQREGQLEVLQMPSSNAEERVHELTLFLDWLADVVLLGEGNATPGDCPASAAHLPPRLFLAPDIRVAGEGRHTSCGLSSSTGSRR
jgi:hypothetical protein